MNRHQWVKRRDTRGNVAVAECSVCGWTKTPSGGAAEPYWHPETREWVRYSPKCERPTDTAADGPAGNEGERRG